MSVINISNLLVQLNQKISLTSDDKEILILVKALEKLKTGIVFTVPTFANLPDASENAGKLYFVENDGILYFSVVSTYINAEYWAPITNGLKINPLFTWGCNNSGQLGDGTTVSRSSPGTVAGATTNWRNISVGACHAIAIKYDGTIWTWGVGTNGVLGSASVTNRCSVGTVAGGGNNWCFIIAGGYHTSAIKTDGTLWTWGSNNQGQLGDGTTVNRSSPGTVAGAGTNWCKIFAGTQFTTGIKCDGTLWTWGQNTFGTLGDGTVTLKSSPGTVAGGGTNWCQVVGGLAHTIALKTDGTIWTWGVGSSGRLGDGTVTNRSSPGTIAGAGTNWCQVSGGNASSAAIKTDGTLWTWGINSQGILGDGTTVSRSSPGTTAGCGTNWCQVCAGLLSSSAAVKTDGTLWTWGCNGQGQLGDATTVDKCSPGTVAGGGTNWCQVSAGFSHMVAMQIETL